MTAPPSAPKITAPARLICAASRIRPLVVAAAWVPPWPFLHSTPQICHALDRRFDDRPRRDLSCRDAFTYNQKPITNNQPPPLTFPPPAPTMTPARRTNKGGLMTHPHADPLRRRGTRRVPRRGVQVPVPGGQTRRRCRPPGRVDAGHRRRHVDRRGQRRGDRPRLRLRPPGSRMAGPVRKRRGGHPAGDAPPHPLDLELHLQAHPGRDACPRSPPTRPDRRPPRNRGRPCHCCRAACRKP